MAGDSRRAPLPGIRIKFDVRMCKVLTVERAWHAERREASSEVELRASIPQSRLHGGFKLNNECASAFRTI